jgi:hypothetical protein
MSWQNCPVLEGGFETGCHTSAGNNLVLYIQTTQSLSDKLLGIMKQAYMYFTSKRGDRLLPKQVFNDIQYAILNTGVWVPTLIANYTYNRVRSVYSLALDLYRAEIGDPEVDKVTFTDVHNYFLRAFNRWLNDNKRFHN